MKERKRKAQKYPSTTNLKKKERVKENSISSERERWEERKDDF